MRNRKKSATATSATATANAEQAAPKKAAESSAHAKRIKELEDRVDALVSKLGGILGVNVED